MAVCFIILKKGNYDVDTNHTLLEARLVAGSKFTKERSHPAASYKEGVSFPARERGGAQSDHRKPQANGVIICGKNSPNYCICLYVGN